MPHDSRYACAILITLLFLALASSAFSATVYVKWDSPGPTFDGASWVTAFHTIEEGLDAAATGDEVWVVACTYFERIALKNGVGLYGGFAGSETKRDQRNWTVNVTILDASQSGSVVTSPPGATAVTRIDGFTIRNGKATNGAGIYCFSSSSPTITNNAITGNSSDGPGGGIYCWQQSSPAIAGNTISGNHAGSFGGGIYCGNFSSPTITNNVITGNDAHFWGGGVFCDQSSPAIVSNSICVNHADQNGGGLWCYSSSPAIVNNVIAGNTAYGDGGGVFCWHYSSPTILNNSISDNTASGSGGGILCKEYSSPSVSNNIVAFNSSGIYKSGGAPTLRNNCVYGNTRYDYSGIPAGGGDNSLDPLFVNRSGTDLHLTENSPCIDGGFNDASGLPPSDRDGNPRISNGIVDIGAYEFLRMGSLRVTIGPQAAMDAGGKWRRIGSTAWLDSGHTEANVPVGNYTVEFEDVLGWTTPADVTVSIQVGQTTEITGSYIAVTNPIGISDSEYDALVALYSSTDGPKWNNKTNWLTENAPWYGVIIEGGHVTRLNLWDNGLSGPIPPEIGGLPYLHYLYLDGNEISGGIPAEIGNLSNLYDLWLSNNQLTGEIPPEIGDLSNLEFLWLDGNQLEGPIPPEIGNLSNLEWLWLDGNRLTGEIPDTIMNLTWLVPGWWTSISYNALQSSDSAVQAFLADQSPGWADTQTVPPTQVTAAPSAPGTADVTWTPILYTDDAGHYEVGFGTSSEGPFTFLPENRTADKAASSLTITGLPSSGDVYVVVRTTTLAHEFNQSQLTSPASPSVLVRPTPPPRDYFPLFKGLYATYRGFDPAEGDYYVSAGISSVKDVNGTMTYVMAFPDGNAPDKGYWAVAKVDGALTFFETYSPESGTVTFNPPLTFMPANPTVGAQWTYTDEEGDFHTATVLAVETVITPAGTFHNCIKVKRQGPDSYQLHWYAPNIGEVKVYDEGGTVKETEEIVSFTQGASCDETAPSVPVVTCERQSYGNALHGVFTSSDPESGVVEYQIAMSTTPDESGILQEVGWNSQAGMTSTTSQGMGEFLEDGHTYYALVKARNGAGLWSGVGVSGPITVHLTSLGTSPWPLEVGNIWRYQIHSTESGDRVSSISVTRSIQVGGQTRYVVSEGQGFYDAENEPQEMTCVWSNGSMNIYGLDGEASDSLILGKDPMTTGLTWDCQENDGGVTHFEVVTDSETIVTPAGTFTGCAKLRQTWSDWPDSLDVFWFKPGIGTIVTDTYEDYDWVNVKEHRVLTDWHVHAGPTDITPPTTPTLADDGTDSYGNILRASWVSGDPESAIADYHVAVSTTPSEAGILSDAPWRSTCGSNAWSSQYPSGVQYGETYYILVKALNSGGLWSDIGVSDGIAGHSALPTADWFPLQVGNTWRYVSRDHATGLESRFSGGAVNSTMIDGAPAYTVVNLRGTCDSFVLGDRPDGRYLYANNGTPMNPPCPIYTYPLYEGQQHTCGGLTTTVVSLDETVTVPAGTFTGCMLTSREVTAPTHWRLLSWRAPGVGIVYEERHEGGGLVSSQELVGYCVQHTDAIPPTSPVILYPNGTEYLKGGAPLTVTWAPATDDLTPESQIAVRLEFWDGLIWTTIADAAPNTGSYQCTVPAADSPNCLTRATAVDLAGNPSMPDTSDSSFTVDSTPPNAPIVISPNGGEQYAAGSLHPIQWSLSLDALTAPGDIAVAIEIHTDGGWQTLVAVPNTGSHDWTVQPWLDTADARIRLTAFDRAGNASITDESDASFLIDSHGPVVQITQGPAEGSWQTGDSTRFEWSATDNHTPTAGIEFSHSLDYGDWTAWSSDTSADLASLSDGNHVFSVKARDSVGNEGDTSKKFGVDTTPPTKPHVVDDGPCTDVNSVLHATWSSYDSGSAIAKYQYAIGTSPTDPGSGYTVSWTDNAAATDVTAGGLTLQEGTTYYFYVKALDGVDQESEIGASDGIKVDTVALEITNVVLSATTDRTATIEWQTNKPASTQIEYGTTTSYGSLTPVDTLPVTSHSATITGLTPGTEYHFRAKSSDGCRDETSPDGTFTTDPPLPPDLLSSVFEVPTSGQALGKVRCSWRVQNDGDGSAEGSWQDGVYLSVDGQLDGADVLLGFAGHSTPVVAGSEYAASGTFDIPVVAPGLHYLIVKADKDNSLVESDETNNTLAKPFDIVLPAQLIAAPGEITLTLDPGVPATGEIQLGNLGATQLTGVTATLVGTSPNIGVQITPPSQIDALTLPKVQYTVVAADESVASNSPKLHFTSAEGPAADVRFKLSIRPRHPRIEVNPASVESSMIRGAQTTIECEIENTGAIAATNVVVALPPASWMSLVTPEVIGTLAPGGKAKVGVLLKPPVDMALGVYTGTLGIAGTDCGATIGFTFYCVSDLQGDLVVYAEDEFTYFSTNNPRPRIAGAKVTVTNPYTGVKVAEGLTNSSGACMCDDLAEGRYSLEVSAEKHGTHRSVIEVSPGRLREVHAFLARELVTYTWTVVPVATDDHYRVTLDVFFETNVPAPVVTVEPAYLDLRNVTFDAEGTAVVNYTITNHGLIAAENNTFEFGQHRDYEVTPLTKEFGRLEACSSVVVPVTIRKLSAGLAQSNSSGLVTSEIPAGCHLSGYWTYVYYCVGPVLHRSKVWIQTMTCPRAVPTDGGSGTGFGTEDEPEVFPNGDRSTPPGSIGYRGGTVGGFTIDLTAPCEPEGGPSGGGNGDGYVPGEDDPLCTYNCVAGGSLTPGTVAASVEEPVIGDSVTFTASGVEDSGGWRMKRCPGSDPEAEYIEPGTVQYRWEITVPNGPKIEGDGPTTSSLSIEEGGVYSCKFTATVKRACAPQAQVIGPKTIRAEPVTAEVTAVNFLSDHDVLTDYDSDFAGSGGRRYDAEPEWTKDGNNDPITHSSGMAVRCDITVKVTPADMPFEIEGASSYGELCFTGSVTERTGEDEVVRIAGRDIMGAPWSLTNENITWCIKSGSRTYQAGVSGPHTIYFTWGRPDCKSETPAYIEPTLKRIRWVCGSAVGAPTKPLAVQRLWDDCALEAKQPERFGRSTAHGWALLDGGVGDCDNWAGCMKLAVEMLGAGPAGVGGAYASTVPVPWFSCMSMQTRLCPEHRILEYLLIDFGPPTGLNQYEGCCVVDAEYYAVYPKLRGTACGIIGQIGRPKKWATWDGTTWMDMQHPAE